MNKYPRSGYVYLLMSPSMGLFKIGRTISLPGRLKTLRTGAPDLCILASGWFTDSYRMERVLHRDLASVRKKGEYFDLNPTRVQRITNLLQSQPQQT